ncbi:pentapeptide repeat-containing protein [Methylocystis silviterrae]|uniref:pentapeptide repeat-containing protein n=1 Tax=Methylocystis silviterrae TaxID=2743612 RepID=UPI0038CC1471
MNLTEVNLAKVNLAKVNLAKVNLAKVNLAEVNLAEVDLVKADLVKAREGNVKWRITSSRSARPVCRKRSLRAMSPSFAGVSWPITTDSKSWRSGARRLRR